jgi:Cys-tRNA(Pro) deacylase
MEVTKLVLAFKGIPLYNAFWDFPSWAVLREVARLCTSTYGTNRYPLARQETIVASRGERFLIDRGIPFESLEYDFQKKGAEHAAEALGVPLDVMLKSLVVQLSDRRFVFVLMPGTKDVSLKELARFIGVKEAQMASERDAQRLTGYLVGGISPFGARTQLPVYVDRGVVEHGEIYINGGRRGLILKIKAGDLVSLLQPQVMGIAR